MMLSSSEKLNSGFVEMSLKMAVGMSGSGMKLKAYHQ